MCTACTSIPVQNLAKSDVDLVSEVFIEQMAELNRELLEKLYLRNPRELAKMPGMTVEQRWAMLAGAGPDTRFAELNGRNGVAAMDLAFEETFGGDRVFALCFGLSSMLRQSYGHREQLYLFDQLDGQKIYRAARNIEILVWKLNHREIAPGIPFVLASRSGDGLDNQSFDRLYGKMIALQDMLARIVADSNDRAIKTVVQNTLTTVFLPL